MVRFVNQRKDGFASRAEAKRAAELRLLQHAGEIHGLRMQPRYELLGADGRNLYNDKGRKIHYTGDFAYYQKDGTEIIEDVKGYDTRDSILRRAIMRGMGEPVTVIKRTRRGR